MEALLVFDATTQQTLTLRPQPKFTRKKTGCLTCRARRKKCGEQKPVCIGCSQNHLLCTWPTLRTHRQAPAEQSIKNGAGVHNLKSTRSNLPMEPRLGPNQTSPMAANILGLQVLSEVPLSSDGSILDPSHDLASLRNTSTMISSNPSTASRLGTNPAWWPKLQHDQGAQMLLQHYVERTAPKIAAINSPEQPFVSHLLPLAYSNDGILHALLALSSSHLSFRGETSTALTHSHYAVALRAAKYEVTNVAKGKRNESLHLLVLLLLLCQFEGINGNMNGAILYHLTACKTVLSIAQELMKSLDKDFVCFLLEQYVYLKIVANNVGLTAEPNEANSSIIKELTGSNRSLMCWSSKYGFMFGYAYDLFEVIPQIAQFAHRREVTSPRHEDAELLQEFFWFEHWILEWKPQPRCPLTSAISKELDDSAHSAGLIYQQALLVFLRIALNGPGVLVQHLMVQVDHSINEFLQLLKALPLDSPLWATLLWAVLTIGSCLRKVEDQEFLTLILQHQGHEMHGCTRVLMVLKWVWENYKDDEKFYGPYGIDGVLRLHNVKLSFV